MREYKNSFRVSDAFWTSQIIFFSAFMFEWELREANLCVVVSLAALSCSIPHSSCSLQPFKREKVSCNELRSQFTDDLFWLIAATGKSMGADTCSDLVEAGQPHNAIILFVLSNIWHGFISDQKPRASKKIEFFWPANSYPITWFCHFRYNSALKTLIRRNDGLQNMHISSMFGKVVVIYSHFNSSYELIQNITLQRREKMKPIRYRTKKVIV